MDLLYKIGSIVGSGFLFLGSLLSPQPVQPVQPILSADATLPFAGTTYNLYGGGISAAATTIILTSLTIPQTGYKLQDSDLSDTFYITIEPDSRTRQEIASCTTVVQNTNGTATLTGCVRGLLPYTPYTASSSYAFPHAGSSKVVFSNPPQHYAEFVARGNAERITGIYTFDPLALPRVSSTVTYGAGDELKLATYGALASASFAGTVNGSFTQKGIFQEATTSQLLIGSSTGSTGATLVVGSQFVNQSSTAKSIPIANASGTIDPTYIDQSATANYNFLGSVRAASTTLTATTTVRATLDISNATIVGSSSIPKLSAATVTSSADFITSSTAFVTLGVASTTLTTGAHRVMLTFTAQESFTGGGSLYFDFSVDGTRMGGSTNGLTGTQATTVSPFSMMFLTTPLSAAAHTFRVVVRDTAGTTTILGADPIYTFTVNELYN